MLSLFFIKEKKSYKHNEEIRGQKKKLAITSSAHASPQSCSCLLGLQLHPLPIIILEAQVLENNTSSHDIFLQHVFLAKEFG
jgi:hypothetical protein